MSKLQCKNLLLFLTTKHLSSVFYMWLNICMTKELILIHLLTYMSCVWEYHFLFDYLFWNNSYSKYLLNSTWNLLPIVQSLVTKLVCLPWFSIWLVSEFFFFLLPFSSSYTLKITELMKLSKKCWAHSGDRSPPVHWLPWSEWKPASLIFPNCFFPACLRIILILSGFKFLCLPLGCFSLFFPSVLFCLPTLL